MITLKKTNTFIKICLIGMLFACIAVCLMCTYRSFADEGETEESVSQPSGLTEVDGVWYYYLEDGSLFTDGFKTVQTDEGRKYYYFESDGRAFTGGYKEYTINGKKYCSFFGADGCAFTDGYKEVEIDGETCYFYFLANGVGFTSGYKTVKIGKKTYYYYFGEDGRAVTDGVRKVEYGDIVTYYYLQEDGKAFTGGYLQFGEDYYYYLGNGRCFNYGYKTVKINGETYYFYFNENGKAFKKGLKKIDFGGTPQYYFFQSDGRAFTGGLKEVGEDLYFFESNGRALKDDYKTVDGKLYYFQKNGKGMEKVYTIVLDPGHDGTHTGAFFNGVHEEIANMKIALAMKAELEEYAGVRVYLTHDSLECNYKDSYSSSLDEHTELAWRAHKAKELGADYFISLHNDSTGSSWSDIHGCLMLCQTANYRPDLHKASVALGEKITKELEKIGLTFRGTITRNIDDGRSYPDGSVADYYSVLRNAKREGICAVLIEHAVMTNRQDSALLSSEDGLAKIGKADAHGVAAYLGLSRK